MTTYADLIAEIKSLSKRGDIDDKIAVALRLTTLRVHRADWWWRDTVQANLAFTSSQDATLDTSTALIRFRAVEYLRYYDSTAAAGYQLGPMLEKVDPRDLLDEYNYQRENRWYMAGVILTMRFMYATAGARISYYQNPDVATGTYNSWIKDQLPDILVQGSLAQIYNGMGKQEEAKAINRMCGLETDPSNRYPGFTLLDELRASQLDPQGRA